METLYIILIFILGTIIGSFLNVVIFRLPKEEKLGGRSSCPNCGRVLSPRELVPLFSFLFQGAKCRGCGNKISPQYFFVELATGLLFVFTYFLFPLETVLDYIFIVKALFAICIFVVVFVVDLKYFLILDKVTFWALGLVGLLNIVIDIYLKNPFFSGNSYFVTGIIAAIVGSLPFFIIWFISKGKWMGFGDVKIALFLGFVFGLPLVFVNIFLAVILGGFVSIIFLLFKIKSLKSQIPLGVFLSLSGVITIYFGQEMLAWYLALLGF